MKKSLKLAYGVLILSAALMATGIAGALMEIYGTTVGSVTVEQAITIDPETWGAANKQGDEGSKQITLSNASNRNIICEILYEVIPPENTVLENNEVTIEFPGLSDADGDGVPEIDVPATGTATFNVNWTFHPAADLGVYRIVLTVRYWEF